MSDLSKINFGGTEYNIKDTTARTEVAEKVTASGGDISNTKIVTADNITTEFPVPAVNDTAKGFLGKMKKFCTDFNNFKNGVITLGKLVNNGQCTEPGFALDARYGKALYDLFAQLNRDFAATNTKLEETTTYATRAKYLRLEYNVTNNALVLRGQSNDGTAIQIATTGSTIQLQRKTSAAGAWETVWTK